MGSPHDRMVNARLTQAARKARKEKIAEEKKAKRLERAAELKRRKLLTSTVRGVKVKQRQWKDLKKECLSELRAALKLCGAQEKRLKDKFSELEKKLDKLSDMSDALSVSVSESDIDLSSSIDALTTAIDEVAGADK